MPYYVRKEVTATFKVFEALKAADDLMTVRQLVERTGEPVNRVSAALHMLKIHKAVDIVEAPDTLWWFATPDTDDRSKTLEMRTPEKGPRKPRKPRRKESPRG